MQHNSIDTNCTFLVYPLADLLLARPAIIDITSIIHAVEYLRAR